MSSHLGDLIFHGLETRKSRIIKISLSKKKEKPYDFSSSFAARLIDDEVCNY